MNLAWISNIFFISRAFLAWNTQPAMQGTLHEAHWDEAGIWCVKELFDIVHLNSFFIVAGVIILGVFLYLKLQLVPSFPT